MRIKMPPALDELEKIVTVPKLLVHLFGHLSGGSASPQPDLQYFHWDQLIRRKPPEGLSHHEWWFLLKSQRSAQSKTVPLRDKLDRLFAYVMADPVPEELHKIDQRAGGVIQMPSQITNKESKERYYQGSLMEEAITSSQLEGATTTREVAKDMIRSGRSPRDRSEQMILNNFRTMQHIGDVKSEPMSKELIFQLHRTVTEKTLDKPAAAGRFRFSDEAVVVSDQYGEDVHVPPNAEQLEQRMELMCHFANGEIPGHFIHPVIRSIILHFWLAYDHPFVDGNGRTARALFYWSMLRHGFWLFEFVSISRILVKAPIRYARSFLYTETDGNDLTYFILYQINAIKQAIADLHSYIERKSTEMAKIKLTLSGSNVLNHRQEDLVSHAIRHPGYAYTIKEHQARQKVVYQTARNDMMTMVQLNLMTTRTKGNLFVFHCVADLETKLGALASQTP